MSRARILLAASLALATLATTTAASAQTFARRQVPRGEVTGLEMGIEGSLDAVRGGRVQWFVTLYEVLRRRDLRPAADASIEVTASFAPDAPVARTRTDARGGAALEIPIPDEVEGATQIRVTAVSGRVRRVFEVDLRVQPRYRVVLFTDRDDPAPHTELAVFGRVVDRIDGRPSPGVEVTLTSTSSGPLHAPRDLVTDESGVFATRVEVGDGGTSVRFEARTESGAASESVAVTEVEPPLMWVVTDVEPPVASPGESARVTVRVRHADGRPIAGARVSFDGSRDESDEPPPRTDHSGRIRLDWHVTHGDAGTDAEGVREVRRNLVVVHPGIGTMEVPVRLRVSRAPVLVAHAIEGGALVPELFARVHVRMVTPDGAPVANERVSLEAPILGDSITANTDADGVATFEGTVSASGDVDRCGGPTATAATVVVGRHRQELCLAVDPDAQVRLRLDSPLTTGPIEARIQRRRSVRGRPVEVAALVREGDGYVPVARAVAGGDEDRVRLEPPASAGRELWLRARPILADGRAVVGGGLVVYRRRDSGERLSLSAGADDTRVDGGVTGTTALFAVRARHRTALEGAVLAVTGPVGAALHRGRSDGYVAALLAARTPVDDAATAVLREGEVLPQPLPQDPVAHGLLRDPWRTRARFVRGRLGRLMRAVEDYANAQIPNAIEEVAVREGGRWRFNYAVLHAATQHAGLFDEMVAGLDGEPLDIDALTQLDRAFTFDHVARRITRERLWRVNVLLREYVEQQGLDEAWARRGDPSEYLVSFFGPNATFETQWPERSDLYDAWGTPFALRRARAGRARFTFLTPVPGWEVVSAGPDGRMGTGDDLADPFARVLPSSGIYAEAVGEDVLLARLRGVALGRATVESLGGVFDVVRPNATVLTSGARADGWRALPAPVAARDDEARLTPIRAPIGGIGAERVWELPPERRRYAAVAIRFGRDGSVETARDELEAGLPWAVRLTLPSAMRPGERLVLPVQLVQLADAERPSVEVEARGGAVTATLDGEEITLHAQRPGVARLVVKVRLGDREIESLSRRVRVVPEGSLRARHSGTLATADGAEVTITAPEDATPWRARVVIGAPRSLHRDPLFEAVGETHPTIAAWARMNADGEVDAELLAGVRRAVNDAAEVESVALACALPVLALEDDGGASARVRRAAEALGSGLTEDLSARAAILTALAAFAPRASGGSAEDSLGALLARLRLDGWRALASAPDRPAVMARMAAALLLIDRRDVPGRALLERAAATLEEDDDGRPWVPDPDGSTTESFVGTLALAIAARQAGDDALATSLSESALGRMYLAPRLGADGFFWSVAASAFGAFGVDAPGGADLVVNGSMRRVSLEEGVAIVEVGTDTAAEVNAGSPVWVRTESRYLVPNRESETGVLRAKLEGSPGRAAERAAFELVVENEGDEEVASPIVELTLPGAALLDEVARTAMAQAPGVARVEEPDGAGVVRLHLAPLVSEGTHRVPLPLVWIARGHTRGLSTRSYDARTPTDIATTEGRVLNIEGEP